MCDRPREHRAGAEIPDLSCRGGETLRTDLMESLKAQHLTIGGDAMGHVCVVLTPDPGFADVCDDIAAREVGRSPGIDEEESISRR
jgi:hypothetical protein